MNLPCEAKACSSFPLNSIQYFTCRNPRFFNALLIRCSDNSDTSSNIDETTYCWIGLVALFCKSIIHVSKNTWFVCPLEVRDHFHRENVLFFIDIHGKFYHVMVWILISDWQERKIFLSILVKHSNSQIHHRGQLTKHVCCVCVCVCALLKNIMKVHRESIFIDTFSPETHERPTAAVDATLLSEQKYLSWCSWRKFQLSTHRDSITSHITHHIINITITINIVIIIHLSFYSSVLSSTSCPYVLPYKEKNIFGKI